jgi:hypothetical protein
VLLANGIPAALIAGLQGYATMAAPLKAELQNSVSFPRKSQQSGC